MPHARGSINIRMTPVEFMPLAAWMSRHVETLKPPGFRRCAKILSPTAFLENSSSTTRLPGKNCSSRVDCRGNKKGCETALYNFCSSISPISVV